MSKPTPPSAVERRLASLERAAAYLDTSERAIRRSIAEGRITGYRFGPRLIRVDLDEIDTKLVPIPTVDGAA